MSNARFEINDYQFNYGVDQLIEHNKLASDNWPLVYIISDDKTKKAYVGETANAINRMKQHLSSKKKKKLTLLRLITSEKFNKSATLDMESKLIRYMHGDGVYKPINGNLGMAQQNYYQKDDFYDELFNEIWESLKQKGFAEHDIKTINNSDLFKYSPYKSLTHEQSQGFLQMVKVLIGSEETIMVQGGAGTGKTVLAVFLFKVLLTPLDELSLGEFEEDETELFALVKKLKDKYPTPELALVVPMSSFRETLKKVFKQVRGLKPSMVIGPAELPKKHYDIVLVDESHRLRQRTNLGAYFGTFDKTNASLGFDKFAGNELDWVLKQSKKQILFYDSNQSIKPSDVDRSAFATLENKKSTTIIELKSQFRVRGGNGYVEFIHKVLGCTPPARIPDFAGDYQIRFYDLMGDMVSAIKDADREYGLARMVAGYSWKWVSNKSDDHDISLDGISLKWNGTSKDWVNSKNAVNEVGCIHTTQGYDLNVTGVIFGHEICYDPVVNEIVIKPENYYDANGKNTIKDPAQLKDYILNIYKTILLRGIRGTFIYACDPELRKYLKRCLGLEQKSVTELRVYDVKPVEIDNVVPLFDFKVAAGAFSDFQAIDDCKWCEIPDTMSIGDGYFVCQIVGESMNKVIPNGSWCLFKPDSGGTRNGKIVLVEHYDIQDPDHGGQFTVKRYLSEKVVTEEAWAHAKIVLSPESTLDMYRDIVLDGEQLEELKVVGEFVGVVG